MSEQEETGTKRRCAVHREQWRELALLLPRDRPLTAEGMADHRARWLALEVRLQALGLLRYVEPVRPLGHPTRRNWKY